MTFLPRVGLEPKKGRKRGQAPDGASPFLIQMVVSRLEGALLRAAARERLPVRPAAVIRCRHVHDFVGLVDFEEEPPGPDPISPGRRAPIFEPLNVGAVVRLDSELRIHVFLQLLLDSA